MVSKIYGKVFNPFCLFLTVALSSTMFSCNPNHVTVFPYLTYDSTQIAHWLDSPDAKSFVFQFYSPANNDPDTTSFQLISYVQNTAGYYMNPGLPPYPSPDTLARYKDSLAVFTDSVVLGNNVISKDAVKKLIDSVTMNRPADTVPTKYFLEFIPLISASDKHVYYAIHVVRTKGDGVSDQRLTTDPIDTNPSPPKPPPPSLPKPLPDSTNLPDSTKK